MKTKLIASVIAVTLVSACAGELGGPPPAPIEGGKYSNSVGFTGVSYQPKPRHALLQTAAVSSSGTVAAPTRSVRARGGQLSAKAETAIRNGGTQANTAAPISVANQNLWFTIVDVGDTRFAVLKKRPRFLDAVMRSGTERAFAAQVPSLTGCTPVGAGFGYGPNRAAVTGIAIPITCG